MTTKYILILFGFCFSFTFSCCNNEDVYYSLPIETGKYYDNNDTIRYYCSELGSYESYVICYRFDGYQGDEIRGTYCSWVEYLQSKDYRLYLDSCNSERLFFVSFGRHYTGSWIHINSYYNNIGPGFDYSYVNSETEERKTYEILGMIYDDVYSCSFNSYSVDSLRSGLVSMEFGVIQYSFENLTFSLINDENRK